MNLGEAVPIWVLLSNFAQNLLCTLDVVASPVLTPFPKLHKKGVEFHGVLVADTRYHMINQNWKLTVGDIDISYEVLPSGRNESIEHLSSVVDKDIVELRGIILAFRTDKLVSFVNKLIDCFLQCRIRVVCSSLYLFNWYMTLTKEMW